MASPDPNRVRRFALPELSDERADDAIEAFLNGPQASRSRLADGATSPDRSGPLDGLLPRLDWTEALAREAARGRRYHRPVAVMAIAARPAIGTASAGHAPASIDSWRGRVAGPMAHVLRRGTRATDLVTRTGEARFQLLLPETSVDEATTLAERLVADCEVWLAAVGAPLVVDAAVAPMPPGTSPEEVVARAWALLGGNRD